MNNDNDLNLHLHDQMSSWLRYCMEALFAVILITPIIVIKPTDIITQI